MKRFLNAIDLCCGAGGWACAARGLPIRFVAVADLADDRIQKMVGQAIQIDLGRAILTGICREATAPRRKAVRA